MFATMESSVSGICHLASVPLRGSASDKSEILSFLLFGETFRILEQTEKWTFVQTSFDNYQGWIDVKQYKRISGQEAAAWEAEAQSLGVAVAHPVLKSSTNETLYLLAGSSVLNRGNDRFLLGGEEYIFPGKPSLVTNGDFASNVSSYSRFFLHAPYLWGGRSVFGIDCSGFTQIVFKMLGFRLMRDAWQQAEQGMVVNFLQEAKPGDLAFFDNEEGRIIHVGIMLNEHEIIHASGRVKIDPIDDQGIYSTDLRKHTHRLRIIKRIA